MESFGAMLRCFRSNGRASEKKKMKLYHNANAQIHCWCHASKVITSTRFPRTPDNSFFTKNNQMSKHYVFIYFFLLFKMSPSCRRNSQSMEVLQRPIQLYPFLLLYFFFFAFVVLFLLTYIHSLCLFTCFYFRPLCLPELENRFDYC